MVTAATLLHLVRKLIDYGRELANTLHQRSAADPYFTRTTFGTSDLALILARITRGLQLASALETRLIRRAAQPLATPGTAHAPPHSTPCTARPAAPRTERAEPGPAGLPTAEQIAARLRHQPIGAAIADICRDLGIMPNHELWREVQHAIIAHGGSFARLVTDLINRACQTLAFAAAPDGDPASFLPPPALAGTGPP